jgi:hypothetical protein
MITGYLSRDEPADGRRDGTDAARPAVTVLIAIVRLQFLMFFNAIYKGARARRRRRFSD